MCNIVMDGIQMAPSSNCKMAHGRKMAHGFKAARFLSACDFRDVCEGTILCVSWDRGRLGNKASSEIHLSSRLEKKSCNRDESSMKGWFNRFPLPAESFRELTVKRLMFFKRPAVIFSPVNHKTLEEWLKRC